MATAEGCLIHKAARRRFHSVITITAEEESSKQLSTLFLNITRSNSSAWELVCSAPRNAYSTTVVPFPKLIAEQFASAISGGWGQAAAVASWSVGEPEIIKSVYLEDREKEQKLPAQMEY